MSRLRTRTRVQRPNGDRLLRIQPLMRALLDAYEDAIEARRPPHEFAVEMRDLESCGAARRDLRSIVAQGKVQHLVEQMTSTAKRRRLRPSSALAFNEHSCFVLTDVGLEFARRLNGNVPTAPRSVVGTKNRPSSKGRSPHRRLRRPKWDAERRELRCGRVIVKRFRVRARNQQLILTAFEEQKWCERIDDPLPQDGVHDARLRLHDTIKQLNRNQVSRLIHFEGDGTGEGICWRYTKEASRE